MISFMSHFKKITGFWGRGEDDHPREKIPLLPEAGAGGPPLMAVISVISFLATLSFAGYILITGASQNWTQELRAALTVQITGDNVQDIEYKTTLALEVLENTDGITDFNVMPSLEAEKLLEPWLGEGRVSAYFSVPAIIEVRATPQIQNDLEGLKTRLDAIAPGVLINDHSNWKSRLEASVRSVQILAFSIFLMVMGASAAISIFAARAGLAANRDIVSLLHLVGASDQFIAMQVQRRFLVLGLRGAIMGVLIAVFVLVIMSLATRVGALESAFIPSFSVTLGLVLLLMVVPVFTCLITAFTARLTVLRALREEY